MNMKVQLTSDQRMQMTGLSKETLFNYFKNREPYKNYTPVELTTFINEIYFDLNPRR